MGIRRVYGAGAVGKAGLAVGQAKAAQATAERAERKRSQQAALDAQREERRYRETIRQQDFAIDVQMQERAKMWEIEKMELRSRMDFQREEGERQQKLSGIDNKLTQLRKEKESGRFSADETAYNNAVSYWESQKGFIETGVKPPTEGRQFGVQPYWMQYLSSEYEGTREQQMAEGILESKASGVRTGTVPWYLDPKNIQTAAGRQAQESKGIFLTDEEIESFISGPQVETPTISSDEEYDVLPSGSEFIGPDGIKRRKP